jgi:hypothetical protein
MHHRRTVGGAGAALQGCRMMSGFGTVDPVLRASLALMKVADTVFCAASSPANAKLTLGESNDGSGLSERTGHHPRRRLNTWSQQRRRQHRLTRFRRNTVSMKPDWLCVAFRFARLGHA